MKHLKENNTTYKDHWWRAMSMSVALFIHADFKFTVPNELSEIKVRVIDIDSENTFWLNDTMKTIEFNNYTYNKFGEITIILDLLLNN